MNRDNLERQWERLRAHVEASRTRHTEDASGDLSVEAGWPAARGIGRGSVARRTSRVPLCPYAPDGEMSARRALEVDELLARLEAAAKGGSSA